MSEEVVLDQVVAASKSNYAQIDTKCLADFISTIFNDSVEVLASSGGSEKSGSSSGILIFDAQIGNGESAKNKKLVLRYDPQAEERIFFEYDMRSQYELILALEDTGLPIPKVYGLDETGESLGVSGFIMDCIPGEAIPTSIFSNGLLAESTEDQRQEIYRTLLKTLVDIHSLDYVALGLENFSKNAPGNNAQEKLTNWWWKTWQWANPEELPRIKPVYEWLLKNHPGEPAPVLMHGDPNLGNYLFENGEMTAVLDWELSSVGSPELDLALQVISMEAHTPMADSLPVKPPTQDEWLALYREVGGRPLKNFEYFRVHAAYQVLTCFCSMYRYLPAEVVVQYRQMAEYYWSIAEQVIKTD